MSEALRTHDLSAYAILLGGVPLVGGFAGDAIAVNQPSPDYEEEEGPDGSVTRSRTNSRLVLVTLTFGAKSFNNVILTEFRKTDLATPNGASATSFQAIDTGGTFSLLSPRAYIKGPPTDLTIARVGPSKSWVIACTDCERTD